MGRKFWQTKAFKRLCKEWEERLASSEFEDAERMINGQLVLKQRADNCYRQAHETQRESKARYYQLLGMHFHKEGFTDAVECIVMERRAGGTKIKEICQELRAKGERCHRETVRSIIQKYEIKWGIKR